MGRPSRLLAARLPGSRSRWLASRRPPRQDTGERESGRRRPDRGAAGRDRRGEGSRGRAHVAALRGRRRARGRAVRSREGARTSRRLEAELAPSRRGSTAHEAAAEQTRRLELLQSASYARAVAILEARVRAIYIEESPDVLSFLVSAASFDDLIDNYEFLGRIGLQDQRIARQVERRRRRPPRSDGRRRRRGGSSRQRLRDRRAHRGGARRPRRAGGDRDTLLAAERLKQSALATSRESREEYLAEVEALAAAERSAGRSHPRRAGGRGLDGHGQPSAAGFIWPVNGAVVSGFGMRWGRMHEGIDIAVRLRHADLGGRGGNGHLRRAGSADTGTSSWSTTGTGSPRLRARFRDPRVASGSR